MLDVLGAVIIGGTLIVMIMTFQLQLQENAMRLYFTGSMISHMDEVAEYINHIFSMLGIGFKDNEDVVVEATNKSIKFRTYWDFEADMISEEKQTIEIRLNDATESEFGRVLSIYQQRGETSKQFPLEHILFIEDIGFNYYNRAGNNINSSTDKEIMSAEVLLTFARASPWKPDYPLRSNLQLKCYFMNMYLQKGA